MSAIGEGRSFREKRPGSTKPIEANPTEPVTETICSIFGMMYEATTVKQTAAIRPRGHTVSTVGSVSRSWKMTTEFRAVGRGRERVGTRKAACTVKPLTLGILREREDTTH